LKVVFAALKEHERHEEEENDFLHCILGLRRPSPGHTSSTTSKWNFSPDGTAMGGGGARFRSRDLARFGELLRNGGRWNGRRVLSKAWVEAMLTVRARARDDAEYGYQIWRFHFPHRGKDVAVWAMSGNGGNYVFIAPTLDLVAVITSTAYNQRFAHAQSQEIFREIVLKSLP
jgi:CubicO group peptidase (beta-lactamase class C family)